MKVYVLEIGSYHDCELTWLVEGVYSDYNTAKLAAECLETQRKSPDDFEYHITEWDLL